MFESLKGWVSNIAAIIVFVSIIEIILPDGKMRKYVSLTAGVLVVLIIISPLVGAFNKGAGINMPEINFKEPIPIEELKIRGEKIEKLRSKQVLDTYKAKLERSIQEQVNEIDGVYCSKAICQITEDSNKEGFGDIQEICLYVNSKRQESNYSKIEPISINLKNTELDKAQKDMAIPEKIKDEIIKKISYTFRVSPGRIKINYSTN